MCAKQNACNYFVLGECGRYPLYIKTQKTCIKFWLKILKMKQSRLVKKCYDMLMMDDSAGFQNWVSSIRNCLQTAGYGYVWVNQSVQNETYFLKSFDTRLKDIFLQKWNESIQNNHKLQSYIAYKSGFKYETYLNVLDIKKFRAIYVNFKTSCHTLEIEKGRHQHIPRENRLCKLCSDRVIEDEYHFLLCCSFYSNIRQQYIPDKYLVNVNLHKFNLLLSSENENVIKAVSSYLLHAFKVRQEFLNAVK